jgi:hypothetical protein
LTNDGASGPPEWSPDGRRIAWTRVSGARRGTYWRPWDLSAPEEVLVDKSLGVTFSPQGNFFLTNVGAPAVVTAVQLDSSRRQRAIVQVAAPASRISPDGRWVLYQSFESGIRDVYMRAIDGSGGVYQISNNGGFEPTWNPRGGEIFYRAPTHLVSAKLEFSPAPRVVRRDTLFSMILAIGLLQAQYDVAADGNHFLMPKPIAARTSRVIVTDWLGEIRERLKQPTPD